MTTYTITIEYDGSEGVEHDEILTALAEKHNGEAEGSGFSMGDCIRDIEFAFLKQEDAEAFEKQVADATTREGESFIVHIGSIDEWDDDGGFVEPDDDGEEEGDKMQLLAIKYHIKVFVEIPKSKAHDNEFIDPLVQKMNDIMPDFGKIARSKEGELREKVDGGITVDIEIGGY